MKFRRKHTQTDISSVNWSSETNQTTVTYLCRCKLQVKLLVWITIKVYYIDVLTDLL